MKKTNWPGNWKVMCHQCGFFFPSGEIKKRWDGLLVCKEDYETRHPQTLVGPHRTEKPPPFVSKDTDDSFTGTCDFFSSMGLSGYGTTGCARVSTYSNVDLPPVYDPTNPSSSLGSSTSVVRPYNPDEHDSFFNSIVIIHNGATLNDTYPTPASAWTLSANGTAPNTYTGRAQARNMSSGKTPLNGGVTFARAPSSTHTFEIFASYPGNPGNEWTWTIGETLGGFGTSGGIQPSQNSTQFTFNWYGVLHQPLLASVAWTGIAHICVICGTGGTSLYINGVRIYNNAGIPGPAAQNFCTISARGTVGGQEQIHTIGPWRFTNANRYGNANTLSFTPPTYRPFPTQL